MVPEFYKVVDHGRGFVAVMPRPRANDWLSDELRGLKRLGVSVVASLLEREEEFELGLHDEATIAQEMGLRFFSFPIPDRGTPSQLSEFCEFVRSLAENVRSGAGVAIHCRAGIGRAGITSAATLVALGYDPASVFDMVSAARGIAVPDTEAQVEWVRGNWRKFAD